MTEQTLRELSGAARRCHAAHARLVTATRPRPRRLLVYGGRESAVPADGGLRVDGEVDHGHLGVGRAALVRVGFRVRVRLWLGLGLGLGLGLA